MYGYDYGTYSGNGHATLQSVNTTTVSTGLPWLSDLEKNGGGKMNKNYVCEELLTLWHSRSVDRVNELIKYEKDKVVGSHKSLNALKKLEDDFATKIEKLNSDFFDATGMNLVDSIPEDYVSVSLSEIFEEEFNEINSKYTKQFNILRDTKEEVICHLKACEARDQGLAVLKEYKILDTAGKINITIK